MLLLYEDKNDLALTSLATASSYISGCEPDNVIN